MDLEARKRTASDEARPFKEEAARKQHEADRSKERLQALKKARPLDQEAVVREEEQFKQLTREMREAAAKAQEIEYAVYDLKAVNPHRKQETDERTPEELLEIIEQKGREIAEALAVLRS